MKRQQQALILRLWQDWCRVWPEQYGHESLQVKAEGYDPVFDVIPAQAYKDFYVEVVREHPMLRQINPFEVVDAALNQVRAPETTLTSLEEDENVSGSSAQEALATTATARVVELELKDMASPETVAGTLKPTAADEVVPLKGRRAR